MTALPFDVRDHDDWLRAKSLVAGIYAATSARPPQAHFPPDERFNLVAQLRRAAVSIAANVAEATGRSHAVDQARFLDIACGSAAEVDGLLEVSFDLGYIESKLLLTLSRQAASLKRRLAAQRAALRRLGR